VPFVPRSFDIWTLERVSHLVEEMRPANLRLRAATFINRADARGQDNSEAAEMLRDNSSLEYCGVALGTRKAFANAAAEGLAVSELRNPDPKALEEMRALYAWVFSSTWTASREPLGDITDEHGTLWIGERKLPSDELYQAPQRLVEGGR
jgi:chromosome partitioning protein